MRQRVTQSDIAKACGVSKMTVSMALRKHPNIPEKTRIRIEQKAEELGYQTDPMLSALNHYSSSRKESKARAVLAWINPYRDPQMLRSFREFRLYWEGAATASKKMGFKLEEFRTAELSLSRMDTIFKTRNIQGLLFANLCGPDLKDPTVDFTAMPWEDYAIVRFGRRTTYPLVHFVTSDQTANTLLTFDRLKEKGYQRIGFVGVFSRAKTFFGGVAIAQQSFPECDRLPPLRFNVEESPASRKKRFAQWIQDTRPDAILTESAETAGFLSELGMQVPKDIALATTSIHDTSIDAGIDQNSAEIGRAAVRMLVTLLNDQDLGIPTIRHGILIEGNWVDGSMLPSRH